MEKEICKAVAGIYAGKNWHHELTGKERDLVRMLERCKYIIPNNPANGFVGKVA